MAAIKTSDTGTKYHVADANGNHTIFQSGPAGSMRITSGGINIDLSKQNISDLLPALTAFANTGVLS